MINKKLNQQLVSDDFGLFSEMYPSVYVLIGASGNEDKYKKGVLHSSYVCMNDELLPFGTNLLVETARRFFESDNTYDKSGGFYESEN